MGLDVDEAAAVIDKHTGRVRGQFIGFGAIADANAHLQHCKAGGVEHLSSATVITGDEARRAIAKGRV